MSKYYALISIIYYALVVFYKYDVYKKYIYIYFISVTGNVIG